MSTSSFSLSDIVAPNTTPPQQSPTSAPNGAPSSFSLSDIDTASVSANKNTSPSEASATASSLGWYVGAAKAGKDVLSGIGGRVLSQINNALHSGNEGADVVNQNLSTAVGQPVDAGLKTPELPTDLTKTGDTTGEKLGATAAEVMEFIAADGLLKGNSTVDQLKTAHTVAKAAEASPRLARIISAASRMGTIGAAQGAMSGDTATEALTHGVETGLTGGVLDAGVEGVKAGYDALTKAPELASTLRGLSGLSESGTALPSFDHAIKVATPDITEIADQLSFTKAGNARVGEFVDALRNKANAIVEDGGVADDVLKRAGALDHIADTIEQNSNNSTDVKRLGLKEYGQRIVAGALGGSPIPHVGPVLGAVAGTGEAALEDFSNVRNAPGAKLSRMIQGLRDTLDITPEEFQNDAADKIHPFNAPPEERPNPDDFTPTQIKTLQNILRTNSDFHSGLPVQLDSSVSNPEAEAANAARTGLPENTKVSPTAIDEAVEPAVAPIQADEGLSLKQQTARAFDQEFNRVKGNPQTAWDDDAFRDSAGAHIMQKLDVDMARLKGKYPKDILEDIRSEATAQTIEELQNKIGKFDPSRNARPSTWLDWITQTNVLDAAKKVTRPQYRELQALGNIENFNLRPE